MWSAKPVYFSQLCLYRSGTVYEIFWYSYECYCYILCNVFSWFETELFWTVLEIGKWVILYIKMNVCLYLIQIHISEPIGTKLCTRLPRGLEETVGHVWAHNISPFPPFRPILLGAGSNSCTVAGCRRHTTLLLHYIGDAACAGVTSCTVGCAMKTGRSERNASVWKWKPDETGRKWLMNCTCSYIAFIQMIT